MNQIIKTSRSFGTYSISFREGRKKQNDYVVLVNGEQVTDEKIFQVIHRYATYEEAAKKLLCIIWNLGKKKKDKESDVFDIISKLDCSDELKTYLYVIWHRLVIDDINYPQGNGRKRLLGQVYLLIAKKFSFELLDFIYQLPREVYKLGFNDAITEQVKTDQWDKVYQKFEEFIEKFCQSVTE